MAPSATLRIPVKYLVTLAIVAISGALAGGVFAVSQGVTYSASTTLIVIPAASKSGDNLSEVSSYIFANMASYDALATTSEVLDEAATELGGKSDRQTLTKNLGVQVPTGSSMITISSTKSERALAVGVADAVGNALVKSVVELSPRQNDEPVLDVTVVQPAQDGVRTNSPNVGWWILGGLVVGLVLGVLLTRLLFGPAPVAPPRATGATPEP